MPDDTELIKAGTQGMIEGALKPFSDLIQSLFGPAATEAGLMLRDHVHSFRMKRQVRLLERTNEVLHEARIEPQQVPLKVLAPIFENASLEENDDLQDIWANMLANAANPQDPSSVAPSFQAILKELSARDVKFLDRLYEEALKGTGGRQHGAADVEDVRFDHRDLLSVLSLAGLARFSRTEPHTEEDKKRHKPEADADEREVEFVIDLLKRQGIVVQAFEMPVKEGKSNIYKLGIKHSLSHLGMCFVEACRPPKATKDRG